MESHLLIGRHGDGYIRSGRELKRFDFKDEVCVVAMST